MTILEPAGKWLLFFHLVGAFVLIGSQTHFLVIAVSYFRRRVNRLHLLRLYALINLIAFVTVFVLGALVYPNFRVHVRAEYFDVHLPAATAVFEIKEHLASLGMALSIWIFSASRRIDEKTDKFDLQQVLIFSLILYLIGWYLIAGGYVLTTIKGI